MARRALLSSMTSQRRTTTGSSRERSGSTGAKAKGLVSSSQGQRRSGMATLVRAFVAHDRESRGDHGRISGMFLMGSE